MPLTWSLFHRNPDTFPLPKFNIMYLLKTMLFFFKFEITFYPDQQSFIIMSEDFATQFH